MLRMLTPLMLPTEPKALVAVDDIMHDPHTPRPPTCVRLLPLQQLVVRF